MAIQTFAFPNNCAIFLAVGKKLGVSAYAQLEIFVVKRGSTCENIPDLDKKTDFQLQTVEKVVRGPQKYFCSQNTIVQH